MRPTAALAAFATLLAAGCDSPPAQNAPPENEVVNATLTDQAYPSGADGNQIITGSGMDTDGPPGPGNAPQGADAAGGRGGGEGQGNQGAAQQGNSQ